jgi:hypothetical protein
MNTYAAIPTIYKGVQFRSRLEATWAAFFDLVHWGWKYEPIDLNGYIPDFILTLKDSVLAEVKPCLTFDELREHRRKIEESGWDKEALILGCGFLTEKWKDRPALGLLGEHWTTNGVREWSWDEAVFFSCAICGLHSFCSFDGSYACRVRGCYDGDGHLRDARDVEELWREVQNATQWRAR